MEHDHPLQLEGELLERLAEALHELFRSGVAERFPATPEEAAQHTSNVPYGDLPEHEKEQNRGFVRDIPAKLASVDLALVPARGSAEPAKISDAMVEELARREHDRWMLQKIDQGWRWAEKTDKARLLHKDIVPWGRRSDEEMRERYGPHALAAMGEGELDPDEQRKDRYLVAAIPRILTEVGYTIVPRPLPFRIRVGVVSLARPGIEWPQVDRAAVAERIDEAVRANFEAARDSKSLFDEESTRRRKKATRTPLAYTLVAVEDDALAQRSVTSRLSTGDVRRRVEAAGTGRPRSAREQLVDDCDVLLVLTPRALSAKELGSCDDPDLALRRAHEAERPVIALPVSGGAPRVERRSGVNGRSISRLELFNTWVVPSDEADEYEAAFEREVFEEYRKEPGNAEEKPDDVPEAHRLIVRRDVIPFYVRASRVAKHFQEAYLQTAWKVYALAVAAVACVAVAALIPTIAAGAFAAELAVLVAILVLIRRAHGTNAHDKWLEARFLTERLRHATYLVACGVRPASLRIPPHVAGKEPPDLWMALAFEEICDGLPKKLPGCEPETCRLLSDFVREAWVGGQLRYHEDRAEEYQKKSTRFEWAGLAAFGLAIVVAVAHLLILAGHALHLEWPEPPWLEGGLTWLGLVLPAAGASIGGFRAHREYSRLAKRSKAMISALQDIQARLGRVSNPSDLESMLREIEAWMTEEAQGWLVLLAPRKLEAV